MIAMFLKIPFIDKEVANNSYPRKMGRINELNPHNSRKDRAFNWTDVYEKEPSLSSSLESSENKSTTSEGLSQHEGADTEELGSGNHKYKMVIYEIKELLFVVLCDLCFSSAVVHQEGLAAAFGNGLSSACVVKMGAQVTSVICIEEGELGAVGVVHSYEDGMLAGSHKTRLTALNVPPMGLFFPMVLVPDAYPPPPSVWFRDYEDMLEDT